MLKQSRHLVRNGGFSLIETIVALALLSVVLMLVFGSFTYQNNTYSVVDQISEMSQNSAAVGRLIERDIRHAGYMVPPEAAACGIDSSTAPDTLFVSDADAILPIDELAPEDASSELGVTPTSNPSSTGSTTLNVSSTVLDRREPTPNNKVAVPSYDTNNDGANDSDFRVGGGVILVDSGNISRGVACGIVTAVDPGANTVTVNMLAVLAGAAPQQPRLKLVPAHAYRIVTGGGAPTRLTRDGVVLARDVEDLQVSWFYDGDHDDVIDQPAETLADADTGYTNTTLVGDDLREVRVSLVMTTRTNDPRNKNNNGGIGQPRENRTAASSAGVDGKQRRIHSSIVRLRNMAS